MNEPPKYRLLTIAKLADRLGVSRSTIENLLRGDSGFPRPILVTRTMRAWLEHEIDAWIAARPAALYKKRHKRKEARADSPERNSFTLKEIAQRNGFSVPYVYAEVSRGNLKVYRPGGTGHMRVTPEQEARWLLPKRQSDDI